MQMPENDANCEKSEKIEPPSTRMIGTEDVNVQKLRGEGQNIAVGLSVAVQESEKLSLNEMVGLPDVEMGVGMETTSMLNVQIVNWESENEEYLKNENTSAAWLSAVEVEANKKIEKLMNRDQSVARHSLRMSDLEGMLTECGKNIMNLKSEISENAWASCELIENGLEIFSSIEEIVLEIEENAIDE